jgi:ABC-type antimicrobial peptide transport system permease subunit
MSIVLEIRTIDEPSSISMSLKNAVRATDPNVPIRAIKTVDELIDSSLRERISVSRLSGFFAILGVLLASIGLYGLLSYTVAARTRELGVRMALGAQRNHVVWLVLREALLLVCAGVLCGVPAALGGSRLIAGMLYGITPGDPISLAVVAVILTLVAALASYIPARRAANVDPIVALRYE